MAKIKAVIFDLDGTLLNTSIDLANAVNFALDKNGYNTYPVFKIVSFVGNGVKNLVARALNNCEDEKKVTNVLAHFKEYYGDHLNDFTTPYANVKKVLEWLKENKILVAIVSNKYDKAVNFLAKSHFDGLYDIAVGERVAVPKKPAPDMVNIALEKLKVDKDNCLYIGDSEVDILTAKNSNIKSVTVTYGFKSKEFLSAFSETILIDDMISLIDIIKENN